ncbi:MAG TPA: flagellar basal body rod protein FlgC [Clostridia bacterium]|jgi:flagellar basal-body rod protein FlgC|nr:flagellar basal body rod protein FlgC [Clostridia bacterium]
MELIPGFAISGSALSAQKLRLDLIANNIANINSTRTQEGGPYKRLMPVFEERLREAAAGEFKGYGVKVSKIVKDSSPPRLEYNPEHPDANAEGFVEMPNINIVNEMVDMITATRAYEANVTAFNTAKSMALKALEIGNR